MVLHFEGELTMLVVRSIDYRYWTGEAWTLNVNEAKTYPPGGGYEDCQEEAARLRAEMRVICYPTYLRTAQ